MTGQPTDMEPTSAPTTAPTGETEDVQDDQATIRNLEEQVAELRDHLLRIAAESENTRKRAQREVEETRKYATADFAREVLAVSDNLHRALEAGSAVTDPGLRNFMTGVEATERQLLAAFERAGIRKMEPLGQIADPNFHQIMMEVDGGSALPMTVMQVMQDGYMLNDRLLRAALVAVARRPPPDQTGPTHDAQA